jgi:hypothetical protein
MHVSSIWSEAMWDVLRWFLVFVVAVLVIVMGLFLLFGKPLPIPSLF